MKLQKSSVITTNQLDLNHTFKVKELLQKTWINLIKDPVTWLEFEKELKNQDYFASDFNNKSWILGFDPEDKLINAVAYSFNELEDFISIDCFLNDCETSYFLNIADVLNTLLFEIQQNYSQISWLEYYCFEQSSLFSILKNMNFVMMEDSCISIEFNNHSKDSSIKFKQFKLIYLI